MAPGRADLVTIGREALELIDQYQLAKRMPHAQPGGAVATAGAGVGVAPALTVLPRKEVIMDCRQLAMEYGGLLIIDYRRTTKGPRKASADTWRSADYRLPSSEKWPSHLF
uniref:Uncharacterized protein n=1 Tax=Nelumbo nucifera TaxID=4432 RepID=A0A822YR03_NELNU|nr:TPA_asm: hypothetical protein HUJ06_012097 [Nelumbo nucifera]